MWTVHEFILANAEGKYYCVYRSNRRCGLINWSSENKVFRSSINGNRFKLFFDGKDYGGDG